jgi:hypothetical protein
MHMKVGEGYEYEVLSKQRASQGMATSAPSQASGIARRRPDQTPVGMERHGKIAQLFDRRKILMNEGRKNENQSN